ncbi:MAG: PfkB family carbohydrate kinase [Chloroflexota bacterium]
MISLVSVGESSADYYPQLDKTFVGGISLNFAVQAKRCGLDDVSVVSCIGDDNNGQLILQKLADECVDCSHITVALGKSAHCKIEILENGERYFPPNSYHQHVLATCKPCPDDLKFIQQHDILVSRFDISYTRETFNAVIRDLEFKGRRVVDFGDWFDYSGQHLEILPYLPYVDLAFISGDPNTIDAFLPIAEKFHTQFVITLGKEGSMAIQSGSIIYQPAILVPKLVDTTGCGDAFQAGFTVAYFTGGSIEDALKAGAEQAAKTIQHYGAI